MPTFQAGSVNGVGAQVTSISTGDFDQDGDLDVALAMGGVSRSYLGDGAGGFTGPAFFNSSANKVLGVDFDGDGDSDLLSINFGADAVRTYLMTSPSTTASALYAVGDGPSGLAVGRLDAGSTLDVVTANTNAGTITVRLGTGGGALGSASDVAAGLSAPMGVALADFDGDGALDVVVAGDGLALLTGNGDGTFDAAVAIGSVTGAQSIVAADFDGDGDQDLAYSHGGGVSVRLGDGAGGFGAATFHATGAGARGLIAADVTGDGRVDLVVANETADTVSVLRGAGDGTFTVASFATGDGPVEVARGDFNEDGWQDVAVALDGGQGFQILFSASTLSIAADSPASRDEGQSGATTFTFTVTRDGPTTGTASANWAVTGQGSAPAAAADFQGGVFPSGTVSFASGEASKTLTVTVKGDTDIEPNEGFQVTLSNPAGATLATATATATISNDDSHAPPPKPPPTAGGDGADLAILNGGPNPYEGRGGDDMVWGEAGNDTLQGNSGNDTLHGGAGDDWVRGGQGSDALYGEDDADLLFGDRGDDFVHGGKGDDVVEGGEGSDALAGGQGNDVLRGGDGADLLSGDKGDDTLTGGAGADVFLFTTGGGADVVTDFSAAEGDRVQISGSYTLSQAGADVVVHLDGGDTLTLLGVQLSSLPHGWIFS